MKLKRDFFKILAGNGSNVSVGIDPDFESILRMLPSLDQNVSNYHPEQKILIIQDFCQGIMNKTYDYAGAFKFNVGFFESLKGGEDLLTYLVDYSQSNFQYSTSIGDSKNADIGNSNKKYREKMFGKYGFDAMTTNPYMGEPTGLLTPEDIRNGKCIIPVVLTTNEEAKKPQEVITAAGKFYFEEIGKQITEWSVTKNCGVVIGATADGINFAKACEATDDRFVLIPGVGAQGGSLEMCVSTVLRNNPDRLFLVNSSRDIIYNADPRAKAKELYDQIHALLPKGDA